MMTAFSLPPTTLLGAVYLTVADLEQLVRFYTNVIGFRLFRSVDNIAWLGTDESMPLLVLTGEPSAHSKPPRTTGLYHFAILTPSRLALARSLRHLLEMDYPLQGASDHLVSEALYLADPEGNGIELYVDRPRESWRMRDGQLEMATVPLNLNGLLKEIEKEDGCWDGLPAETRIGHVHLHVADLAAAEAFYRELLGFDLMTRYGTSASFLAAGGYHHHIGLNTWKGVGAPPPPPDATGLRQFTIQLPNETAMCALQQHLHDKQIPFTKEAAGVVLRDPSQNQILINLEGDKMGGQGECMPSENELAAAHFQGKHVATIAAKLAK